MLRYMLRHSRTLHFVKFKTSYKSLRLTARNLGYMTYIGFPALLSELAISCLMVVGNYTFIRYTGKDGVAAYSIACYIFPIIFMVYNGIIQSAQPIISYNYGAGSSKRVKDAFKLLLKISFGYALLLWALVMLLPGVFVRMFNSDPVLITFTKTALRVYLAALFMMGIQMACQMTFNSLGRAVESIIVAITRKFVLLLPLIFILPRIFTDNKTMAVYLAEPIADFLAVSFTIVLFTIQFRKALQKMRA